MKLLKLSILVLAICAISSCASGYKTINPSALNYKSNTINSDIKLEYKYNLLPKKYAKKETKKGIKLVAIKLTNNTENTLVFGNDIKLTYGNGNEVLILDREQTFKTLKQQPATYLLYLLLTPIQLFTTSTNSQGFTETTNSIPIGLVIGPGLAGGNIIASSSANKKFKTDLLDYNLSGTSIKQGETVYGLIGIESDSYDAIQVKIN